MFVVYINYAIVFFFSLSLVQRLTTLAQRQTSHPHWRQEEEELSLKTPAWRRTGGNEDDSWPSSRVWNKLTPERRVTSQGRSEVNGSPAWVAKLLAASRKAELGVI